MYERRTQPLLPRLHYCLRVLRHAVLALGLVAVALGIGIAGYHFLNGLPWVDATVNAAMILGGMGPVDTLHTSAAKLFASAYALFSGLAFIAIVGVLFAPVVHRFLHRFHLELEAAGPSDES